MKLTKTFLKNTQEYILDLAYEAGEVLLKHQRLRAELSIKDKGSEGIATQADEESEKVILGALKKDFPDFQVLSEEANAKNRYSEKYKKGLVWVVDPLDGTNNFVNGIPIYCVSIALIKDETPVLGVVYNPTSGECFFAAKGQGAYLVDFRLNPFKRTRLEFLDNNKNMSECIFSPAPSYYEKKTKFETQLSVFAKNIVGARAVRRLGSAALELCYVANGNFDGYWEKNLKPWDTAGAAVICKEANIKISDFNGKVFSIFSDSILVAASPLHQKILGKIS